MTKALPGIGVCVALVAIMVTLGACDFRTLIPVRTPTGIQRSEGLPSKLMLDQAPTEYDVVTTRRRAEEAQWRENIEGANALAAAASSIGLQFLDQYSPMLGPVAPLATFLGGWFLMRRPGDATAKDKERAFNAGQAKAANIADTIARNAGQTVFPEKDGD